MLPPRILKTRIASILFIFSFGAFASEPTLPLAEIDSMAILFRLTGKHTINSAAVLRIAKHLALVSEMLNAKGRPKSQFSDDAVVRNFRPVARALYESVGPSLLAAFRNADGSTNLPDRAIMALALGRDDGSYTIHELERINAALEGSGVQGLISQTFALVATTMTTPQLQRLSLVGPEVFQRMNDEIEPLRGYCEATLDESATALLMETRLSILMLRGMLGALPQSRPDAVRILEHLRSGENALSAPARTP